MQGKTFSNVQAQNLENKAIDDFKDALLKINGSYLRSGGSNLGEVVITLPKLDWLYIKQSIENNPNGGAYKFYSKSTEVDEFILAGIRVQSFKGK